MATKLDVGTLSLKGGVEEAVAMGSGVGGEVNSVLQVWEESGVWEREDYLTLQVHSSGASINQTSSLIVVLAESGVVLENKKRKMTIRPEDNLQEAHRLPAPAPAAAVAAAIHDSKTHLMQITPHYFLV